MEKKNRLGSEAAQESPRAQRARKDPVRTQPRRHSRRAVATPRILPPLARLIHTLIAEKVRFQVVGMSAAILQGVPATTLDTDLWIDLPPRQYIQILNLARKLGALVRANTVVELTDGSLVNFLYEVHGLASFQAEHRHAKKLRWLGALVAVLPLERIYASKRFVGRAKDLAHLPLLEQTMQVLRATKRRSPKARRAVRPN